MPRGSRISRTFGLAKRVEDDSQQTHTGVIMGSASYMAPNRPAATSSASPRRLTYTASARFCIPPDRPAAVPRRESAGNPQQVVEREPVKPGQINHKMIATGTICLSAWRRNATPLRFSRGPGRRPGALAAARPIIARPSNIWERGVKWTKRHPARCARGGEHRRDCNFTYLEIINRAELKHERDNAMKQEGLAGNNGEWRRALPRKSEDCRRKPQRPGPFEHRKRLAAAQSGRG